METKKISLPLPPKKRRKQSQNSNGPPSQTAHRISLETEKDFTFHVCPPAYPPPTHWGVATHPPLPPTLTATTFRRTHTDKWSPLLHMASRSPKTHVSFAWPRAPNGRGLSFLSSTHCAHPARTVLPLPRCSPKSRRRFSTPVTQSGHQRGSLPWHDDYLANHTP